MNTEKKFRSKLSEFGFTEVATSDALCAFKNSVGDSVSLDIDRYYNCFAIFIKPHDTRKEYQLGFLMESAALDGDSLASDKTLEGQLAFLEELLKDLVDRLRALDVSYNSVRERYRIF